MAPLYIGKEPLVLASTSATRKALLESAGLVLEAQAPDVDERSLETTAAGERLDPPALAGRLAAAKALSVSRLRPGCLVIGADQVLALEGRILHKPHDRLAAKEQILALAGRRHALHAAVALAHDGVLLEAVLDSAFLSLRALSEKAVERYLDIAGDEVLASVGAYRIEGVGIHLFEDVQGSHSTILGLPLLGLLACLRARGCLAF